MPRAHVTTPRWIALLAGSLFAVHAAAAGCSGAGDATDSSFGDESNVGHNSVGQGGASQTTTTTDGAGGMIATTGGDADAGINADAACATSSEEATLIPVNMFLQVDKSGSMAQDNKWSNVKAAFQAFITAPGAASLRVALRFWPDQGCDDDTCSIDVCSQPQVDVGPLSDPAHVQALTNLFNQKNPKGLTPMFAALGGAEKWAIQHQQAVENGEKVVVIFVTDGEPTACNLDIDDISDQAANALTSAKVLTFAVGLAGSNEKQMNKIASKGGTNQAFLIGNGNAQADLLAALKAIQKSTVACTFAMPEGEPNKPVDPGKVNVNYTPGDGGDVVQLGQVANEAACGANGGWYYDDPQNPAIITLCKATCEKVQADDKAKIQILLGCDTKPA